MAISSTDSQTAAAPTVEVPVANETDPTPADEGEPKPDTSNTVTSRRLSAPAAARKHSRHAPRAAWHAHHTAASMSPGNCPGGQCNGAPPAPTLSPQTSCLWRTGASLSARELIARRRRPRARRSRQTLT